jgi:hypothetical protein
MDVMAGGAAGSKPPPGDPDLWGIDLDLGLGGKHFGNLAL